ncbi:TetR/AcrR family transcriptional regulator [Kitasatospora sp. NPDC001540]|uniref:TetR/AcrR family transcriptional regulator n=1 Tax=Kitasatospora sp. NPDC001540 TaxID=3364014 RepID=UPI00369E8316
MPAPTDDARQRRVQQRALETRELLLGAAVDVLCDHGYAGFSTLAVGEAAGVSRGRLVHHFPTKNALIEAVTDHLVRSYAELAPAQARELAAAPQPDRAAQGLGTIWQLMNTRDYQAFLELLIGTRHDPELRPVVRGLERRLESELMAAVRFVSGPAADSPEFGASLLTALQAMRGLLLISSAGGHDLAAEWETVRERLLLLFRPVA